jgi:rSAM/selenodomain-associated transferase 1
VTQFLVLAKAPVAGRVKTRLCPPCTPEQAARIAAAALADTVDAVAATTAVARTLVIDGSYPPPAGWASVSQRGATLGERLAHAYADTQRPGLPSVLIGMDTPQVTPSLLAEAAGRLSDVDVVLGLAADGGWWTLGLRDPSNAAVLRDIPTSTSTTGARTLAALRGHRLRVALLPRLRDVDTAADAHAVAAGCPTGSRFAAVVAELIVGVGGRGERIDGSACRGVALPGAGEVVA